MNAILHEDCEAFVLTNEAIEVHLSYLRPAVEALGGKIDQLNKKLDDKLDEFNRKFDDRLGEVNRKLDDKLDELNRKFDDKLGEVNRKLDDKLGEVNRKLDDKLDEFNRKFDDKLDEVNNKIDQRDRDHIDRFSRIQASLDGLKWFLSSAAVLASGVSIAHSLGWI